MRIKSRSPLSAGGFQVLPEKTRKRVSSLGASGVGARRMISPFSAVTEQVADEQNLPVAVAAFFPFGAAVARVDAREDAVIEAVEVAVAMDETRHLHAELERLPDPVRSACPRRFLISSSSVPTP